MFLNLLFYNKKMKYILIFIGLLTVINSFKFHTVQNDKADNSTVFVVFNGIYPDAHLAKNDKIYLRGDNCNLTWTTAGVPMSHSANDTWSTMLSCQTGVLIQVKLVLNDKIWMMGGNFWFLVNNRSTITIYPSFYPTINPIIESPSIASSILKNSRKCSIYVPPSFYDNPYKKYELIFMHDGQNLFNDSKAAFGVSWKIQDTLNDLIGKADIQEVIVVGIWNTNDRNNQYTYSYDPNYDFGGKGDLYLDFIQHELQPIVKNQWFNNRLMNSYGYTIGGSSLGGLISCYAMYTRPTFFKNAICMSSSFWWNNEDFNNKVITNKYNTNTILYLDSGDSGTMQDAMNQTLRVKSHFQKIGYQPNLPNKNLYYYLDKGGEHNQYYWGRRFSVPIKSLFNIVLKK